MRNHFSQKWVRYIGLGTLLTIIAVISVLGVVQATIMEKGLTEIGSQRTSLASVDDLISEFVEIRGLLSSFVTEEETDILPILKRVKALEALAEEIHTAIPDRYKSAIEQFAQKLGEFKVAMVAYSDELNIRRTGEGVRTWERALQEIEGEAHTQTQKLKRDIRQYINQLDAGILSKSRNLRSLGIVLGLFGVISGLVVAFLLQSALTRPIRELIEVAEVIAKGDLTKGVVTGKGDEISLLGDAIARMAVSLKSNVLGIRDSSGNIDGLAKSMSITAGELFDVSDTQKQAVADTSLAIDDMKKSLSTVNLSAASLTESAQDTSSAVAEMSSSISKVSASSDTFNQMSEDAAASIEQMIASIKEIASSIESISSSSEEVASALLEVSATIREIEQSAGESVKLADTVSTEASRQGISAASSAMEGMRTIRKSVGELSEVINSLGIHSEEIGQIVGVIDSIADETSLISLNAAILAAQAGAEGSAFSVVAREVKSLAERTSRSTREISELIGTVQSEVRSSVKMVGSGLKSVEEGIGLVSEVSNVLRDIQQKSEASTEMAKTIQRATREEAIVINQITESTKNMTEQVSHISQATKEQSRGTQVIHESTENIRAGAKHIKLATSEQLEGMNHINEMAERVHDLAKQIEGAITNQNQKSDEIAGSMTSVQQTAEFLRSAANEMTTTANTMRENSENLLNEIKRFKT